ncbi:MAG: DMT family transporter [Saprospirales bacterium]|nr:DMT family transporter [Saprospirales bacterium]
MRGFFTFGIRYMLLAVTSFSVMNLCVKMLPGIPPMEMVFFRCLVSFLICAYILTRAKHSWLGNRYLLLIARGASGTLALYFFFVALQNLPLATAVTISYLSPVFSTLFAAIFLKEKVRPIQWVYFGVSLLGVILLKGWDPRVTTFYFVVGLLSAVFSGVAYTLVRTLKETEHPIVIVMHFQIVGMLAGAVFSAAHFQVPHHWEWLGLLAVGLLTQAGQVNLTKALQLERVGIATSLNFVGVIYAAIFGWVLFSEHLTLKSLFAISLVAAGVVLNILEGRKTA